MKRIGLILLATATLAPNVAMAIPSGMNCEVYMAAIMPADALVPGTTYSTDEGPYTIRNGDKNLPLVCQHFREERKDTSGLVQARDHAERELGKLQEEKKHWDNPTILEWAEHYWWLAWIVAIVLLYAKLENAFICVSRYMFGNPKPMTIGARSKRQ